MRVGVFRGVFAAAALGMTVLAASPACAGSVSRTDFTFPTEGGLKVVVFRPDVHVGSLKVGGLDEPNVDWTEAARTNIQAALTDSPEFKDSDITFTDELYGDNAQVLSDYRGMFELVAGAMATHATLGMNALPTKQVDAPRKPDAKPGSKPKKITSVDWTLGDGASKLRDATGADYAIFLYTHDAYGDTGRKVAQFFAAALLGVYMPAGIHIGYAGLVDLKTGNIVWFNTDIQMGGDVREVDGAQKRVRQLLAGFPSRTPLPVVVAAK